ncbi:ATP-binding protein [Kitasatospora sp. NPDC096147]|uniref:ATP-binding protein n=1 Tax=Kitasatospora sp. NPDC096147 TaxID=3364093 RepID=UPI00380D135D
MTTLQVWETDFPARAEAARLARSWVRGLLTEHGWPEDRADDVVTICSELVTNVLLHASGHHPAVPVRLELDRLGGSCRLEVSDSRTERGPVVRPAGVRDHGQGMRLVDALAADWGVTARGAAKTVWAVVLHGAADPEAADRGVPAGESVSGVS